MDNFLFKYNLQITINHPLKLSKTIKIVLPNISAVKTIKIVCPNDCLEDNGCGFPDNSQLSDRMVHRKTIWDCLPEFALPRQWWLSYRVFAIVWKTIVCVFLDNLWLSDRGNAFKTILNCLTEWRLSDRVLNCLASLKIVFLLCLVLARQSEIVLPLLLCLCYSQLSCLSIVLQVQMLCL